MMTTAKEVMKEISIHRKFVKWYSMVDQPRSIDSHTYWESTRLAEKAFRKGYKLGKEAKT